MSDRGKKREEGFTLIETVAALSILVMAAVFLAGFIHPQMKLYYDYDRISQARSMCSSAYRELEEDLRYGYLFYCDHRRPEELAYYIRDGHGLLDEGDVGADGETSYEELPSYEQWPRISAEELDVRELGGMTLELDFTGTENTQAHVSIKVRKDEEIVYEQKAFIRSMYGYTIEREIGAGESDGGWEAGAGRTGRGWNAGTGRSGSGRNAGTERPGNDWETETDGSENSREPRSGR